MKVRKALVALAASALMAGGAVTGTVFLSPENSNVVVSAMCEEDEEFEEFDDWPAGQCEHRLPEMQCPICNPHDLGPRNFG